MKKKRFFNSCDKICHYFAHIRSDPKEDEKNSDRIKSEPIRSELFDGFIRTVPTFKQHDQRERLTET